MLSNVQSSWTLLHLHAENHAENQLRDDPQAAEIMAAVRQAADGAGVPSRSCWVALKAGKIGMGAGRTCKGGHIGGSKPGVCPLQQSAHPKKVSDSDLMLVALAQVVKAFPMRHMQITAAIMCSRRCLMLPAPQWQGLPACDPAKVLLAPGASREWLSQLLVQKKLSEMGLLLQLPRFYDRLG